MTKMIIGQEICQLAITLLLNFGGRTLLGYDQTEDGTKRLNTLVFNTFVWLQIFNEVNNRRLDNKLNVFDSIHKNSFFLLINLIMIGGQVLIIFFGREAFKIVPLDGKEWGLSIGLGAISLPWGALIRLFPDAWVVAMLPWFMRKKGAPETISKGLKQEHLEEFKPPLRAMSTIRGPRVKRHVGFREKMHDAKAKAKSKV